MFLEQVHYYLVFNDSPTLVNSMMSPRTEPKLVTYIIHQQLACFTNCQSCSGSYLQTTQSIRVKEMITKLAVGIIKSWVTMVKVSVRFNTENPP